MTKLRLGINIDHVPTPAMSYGAHARWKGAAWVLLSLTSQYLAFYLHGTELSDYWALIAAFGLPLALWYVLRLVHGIPLLQSVAFDFLATAVLTFFSALFLFVWAAIFGRGFS